jgi:hypothetical protein
VLASEEPAEYERVGTTWLPTLLGAGGAPVTGEPAVAPEAGAGPDTIGTLPGRLDIPPTTFSFSSADGRVILQTGYSV